MVVAGCGNYPVAIRPVLTINREITPQMWLGRAGCEVVVTCLSGVGIVAWYVCTACAVLVVVTSLGCRSKEAGPTLIPVSGIVKLNGQVLPQGSVSFRDSSGLIQPYGEIGPDGKYELFLTPTQKGAPPGKYKVVVFASEAPEEATRHNRLPVLIVNRRYLDAKTTPFSTEIKNDAPPGSYDFSLTD